MLNLPDRSWKARILRESTDTYLTVDLRTMGHLGIVQGFPLTIDNWEWVVEVFFDGFDLVCIGDNIDAEANLS